jgi:hypothetical protein
MRRPTLSSAIVVLFFSPWGGVSSGWAQPPFELRLELPRTGDARTAELPGGWPLLIRVQPTGSADTYVVDYSGSLAVVAADPSGCFSQFVVEVDQLQACLQSSPETIYTKFAIDDDRTGAPDQSLDGGHTELLSALVDSSDGGPVFQPKRSSSLVRLGIATGGDVLDGIGYGANDDWPGLVLLSNRGVGIVLNSAFDPPRRATRRNLAGLLTWTGYELLDERGKSSITAGATVPAGLFLPLMLTDAAVGAPTETPVGTIYTEPVKYRLDGGPVLDGPSECHVGIYTAVPLPETYEIRAFLVQGSAPARLVDKDRDGDVDSLDAALAGFNVISTEARLQFRHWLGENGEYLSGPVMYFADLDGNGAVNNALCSGGGELGPGKIRPPP